MVAILNIKKLLYLSNSLNNFSKIAYAHCPSKDYWQLKLPLLENKDVRFPLFLGDCL